MGICVEINCHYDTFNGHFNNGYGYGNGDGYGYGNGDGNGYGYGTGKRYATG